jgi:hypothetical protein
LSLDRDQLVSKLRLLAPVLHPHHMSGVMILAGAFRLRTLVLLYSLAAMTNSLLVTSLVTLRDPSSASAKISYWRGLYFNVVNTVAPGFTDLIAADPSSRRILAVAAIVNVLLGALFLAVIIGRALLPVNVAIFAQKLTYQPGTEKIVARLYPALSESCYDVTVQVVFMVLLTTESGERISRRHHISCKPDHLDHLTPYHAILVDIPLLEDDADIDDPRALALDGLPVRWLDQPLATLDVIVSLATSRGRVYEHRSYHVSAGDLCVGRHRLLNEGIKQDLTVENWANWPQYRWKNWDEVNSLPWANTLTSIDAVVKSTLDGSAVPQRIPA